VLRRSVVRASLAIPIFDEIHDLEAARNAGVAFGAVTWGYVAGATLRDRSPEMSFSSVDESRSSAETRVGHAEAFSDSA
jgi:phosphoglycolate phosphatase